MINICIQSVLVRIAEKALRDAALLTEPQSDVWTPYELPQVPIPYCRIIKAPRSFDLNIYSTTKLQNYILCVQA